MTDMSPTDYRRAAALINFRAGDNFVGVHSVFVEAGQSGTHAHLLKATVETYDCHLGRLRLLEAVPLIAEWLQHQAANEVFNAVTTRAAAAIIAVREHDQTAFAQIATDANQTSDGPSILIGAVTDLYSMLLPELATPSGLAQLNDCVNNALRVENDTDE